MATKNVKDTVETVKNEAKEAAKKLSKKAEPAVEAAKNTIKTVSEKAEPAVKKAKSAAKAVSDKAEPAVKKAKSAAKAATDAAVTAGKKVASALTQEIYVEYCGEKYDCSNVVERCKEDFKQKHNGERIRSCKIYIKPEDGMVYYVINELADKISL